MELLVDTKYLRKPASFLSISNYLKSAETEIHLRYFPSHISKAYCSSRRRKMYFTFLYVLQTLNGLSSLFQFESDPTS